MYDIVCVDPGKCTGCRICELACSLSNTGACDPARSRIRISRRVENDLFWHVPVVCQRCKRAMCVEACEHDALYRDEATGTIIVDEQACTACRACEDACLFGAVTADPASGIVRICTLCSGDRQRGAQCVALCPTGALRVVDDDDPSARAGRVAMSRERRRSRCNANAAAGSSRVGRGAVVAAGPAEDCGAPAAAGAQGKPEEEG